MYTQGLIIGHIKWNDNMCFFNASGKLNKGKHKRKQRIGKQGKRKDRKQSTIIAEEEIDKAKRNLPESKAEKRESKRIESATSEAIQAGSSYM